MEERCRCPWCGDDPLYVAYHDREWGVPVHDDSRLFEMLTLEGAQAGLSWITILRKRENYRLVFQGFDIERVAAFSAADCNRLLTNPGIVRNRLKVASAVNNARCISALRGDYGSFSAYLWQFVDNRPLQNVWKIPGEIPPRTALSDALSKDLKRRGFNFVGSTICYAFMQAIGMVNDHLQGCFRYQDIRDLDRKA